MPVILNIETSTPVCSCALSCDGEIIFNKENFEEQSHSTLLGVFVEEIMIYVRKKNIKIDAIAVSSGPGSYTGLRIGVSEAKGLAYGLSVPLIAISTPIIMASLVKNKVQPEMLLCPMIDARRMEVYATFFDTSLNVVKETAADIVNENSYADLLEKQPVVFFGNGAKKCKTVLTHPNAHFLDNIHPLASGMISLAERAFVNKSFVDVAYYEPHYLKEYVTTVGKNKVLH
ncbi:MAG: tRNA (adenosine(37)-N6)-threonylcarbamoyltransferase complex dimerization subunit type 1 TsaB [Dysgonamonadaceae bacterium]|jgi:tRNA threonylcarbamoyladenosine biosynthesis protein TsaB|nr:tRNA (adenosine(37)-N6)-threonylcarbamoyltransferase complex dimerization subunit type 1 TsaB [Dysgonamonadaceae bacterium]